MFSMTLSISKKKMKAWKQKAINCEKTIAERKWGVASLSHSDCQDRRSQRLRLLRRRNWRNSAS